MENQKVIFPTSYEGTGSSEITEGRYVSVVIPI